MYARAPRALFVRSQGGPVNRPRGRRPAAPESGWWVHARTTGHQRGDPLMTLTLNRNKQAAPEVDRNVAARAVNATKVYGKGEAEVRALDGVTVDFAAARFTAIMGPSG